MDDSVDKMYFAFSLLALGYAVGELVLPALSACSLAQ